MIWMGAATFLCLLFIFHATECKNSELHEQLRYTEVEILCPWPPLIQLEQLHFDLLEQMNTQNT